MYSPILSLPASPPMSNDVLPTRTLPEKLEDCAKKCDLAIALLTPDDVGGVVGGESQSERVRPTSEASSEASPSRRGLVENVLLEIGWFWGHCGRHSLLLLSRGKVELPSDLMGVAPVPFVTIDDVDLTIRDFLRVHGVDPPTDPGPPPGNGPHRDSA